MLAFLDKLPFALLANCKLIFSRFTCILSHIINEEINETMHLINSSSELFLSHFIIISQFERTNFKIRNNRRYLGNQKV